MVLYLAYLGSKPFRVELKIKRPIEISQKILIFGRP